ncbi:MAG: hypothetical protein V4549_17940 [Bacteroidota bacterium]
MKYEIVKVDLNVEQPVMVEGFDEENRQIMIVDPTRYKINLTVGLHPTNGDPDFSKDVEVISFNTMTGIEVDEQREKAVQDFMNAKNS